MKTYIRSFERAFRDNREYGKFEKIPYMDSLAYMVQEFLYTDKLKDGYYSYQMDETIRLYDFMTLSTYFIASSTEDFGKTTIKGLIEDIKKPIGRYNDKTHVDYTPNDQLVVLNASYELIQNLLWSSYIYASVRYELSNDLFWADVMTMLFELMSEESAFDKEYLLKNCHMKCSKEAVLTMARHMERVNARKAQGNNIENKTTDTKTTDFTAIVEQQAARIKELEAQITELQRPVEELTAEQKIRMTLAMRLMEHAGMKPHVLKTHGNSEKAARIMSMLLDIKNNNANGRETQTCATFISSPRLPRERYEEKIKEINNLLAYLEIDVRI